MKKNNFNSEDHLYLQVADGLEKMIAGEVLRIGDKLPSVRVLSNEYGISMGTAFQAYYHLEGRGLIESRPKSGYYVRFNHQRFLQLPDQVKPTALSHEVSVKEMIASIYMDIAAKDVINFAIGVPDPSLLPIAKINKSVVYALRNSKDGCISYEHTQGNAELRQQVAKLSFNWGGKVKPDEVLITSGCLEAVMMCLKAVTEHGDTVAVECPNYFGIYQAIENLGLKVVEIAADPVHGLDLVALQKAIKKYPIKACVAVPNFNNPLGTCMSDEIKRSWLRLLHNTIFH
ncbi:MAG: PLP-dependent aminotransferase family protein [Ferruginibacter sp.]